MTRRTNEIGVRLALGASSGSIVRLILQETGLLVAAGASSGAVLARLASRSASALLFGVQPTDPVTLTGALLAVGLIALSAGYFPARRAMRIEPVVALRQE